MKTALKTVIAISVIAFASVTMANPKCSHRFASSGSDIMKDTNPVRTVSADKKATETVRKGKR